MSRQAITYCTLCEACCGLKITVSDGQITAVKGDADNPLSKGHLCPKGASIGDIQHDPDRLTKPLKRTGQTWAEISWAEAFDWAGRRLAEVQAAGGKDAVAFYFGNPTGHSYTALLALQPFAMNLGSANRYSAASVDQLPRTLVSTWLYGNQGLVPVPDLDRCDFLLCLGANPVVSQGSAMSSPGVRQRLKQLAARGELVVVDPRRTETAQLAQQHVAVRPGGDAALLLGILHTLFAEGLTADAPFGGRVDGLAALQAAVADFSPERVASRSGVAADEIRSLARRFAAAKRPVAYGRLGTCTQVFGSVSTWLIDALNIVTDRLDRVGGAMFTRGVVDLPRMAKYLGQAGHFGRTHSRVSKQPAFTHELPVSVFAEEMEMPGKGQIRALVTHAGNPARSLPDSGRIEAALSGLDFMVSIDFYLNETTRHADLILPPTSPLERDNFPVVFQGLGLREGAQYAPAVLPKPEGTRHDWEIFAGLQRSLLRHRGVRARIWGGLQAAASRLTRPRTLLSILLRIGPFRQSVGKLLKAPHGVDLGPLTPNLGRRIQTRNKRIQLTPPLLMEDLKRVAADLDAAPPALTLIGRRTLRSMNSWLHNSERLTRGPERCTLLMHPQDAAARRLEAGQTVTISAGGARVQAPLAIDNSMRPGVVSLPHGWGHGVDGAQLEVAGKRPGGNLNALLRLDRVDAVSGVADLNGTPVEITAG